MASDFYDSRRHSGNTPCCSIHLQCYSVLPNRYIRLDASGLLTRLGSSFPFYPVSTPRHLRVTSAYSPRALRAPSALDASCPAPRRVVHPSCIRSGLFHIFYTHYRTMSHTTQSGLMWLKRVSIQSTSQPTLTNGQQETKNQNRFHPAPPFRSLSHRCYDSFITLQTALSSCNVLVAVSLIMPCHVTWRFHPCYLRLPTLVVAGCRARRRARSIISSRSRSCTNIL